MARLGRRAEGLILDDVGEKIVGDRSVSPAKNGYPTIKTSRTDRWKIHRFLWEQRYGEAPELIDHVNGNPKDNRFCNLRAANPKLNQLNKESKGWTYRARQKSKPYEVNIQTTYIGRYRTPEEAAAAYKGAAAILILEEQLKAEKEWLYE